MRANSVVCGLGRRWWVVGLVVACACSGVGPQREAPGQIAEVVEEPAAVSGQSRVVERTERSAELTIEEVRSPEPRDRKPLVVEGEEAGEAEANALFERLPEWRAEEETGESTPTFPAASASPPASVDSQRGVLGGTSTPAAEDGPSGSRPAPGEGNREELSVVRRKPEGDVGSASRLAVTFSKPMIAVGEEASEEPPVRLEPKVAGEWRWVGVRTVIFEPEGGRFPMSTTYEATLDGTAASLDGTELGETQSWSFSTRTLRAKQWVAGDGDHLKRRGRGAIELIGGGGGTTAEGGDSETVQGHVGRDPLFAIGFNQTVEHEEVIDHIRVRGGDEEFGAELVGWEGYEQAEPSRDIRRVVDTFGRDRAVVFRVDGELAPDTLYDFGVVSGAKGAEGPRPTQKDQMAKCRTFPPLSIEGGGGVRGGLRYLQLRFNNELAERASGELDELVEVKPEIGPIDVMIRRRSLYISGEITPETTYKVTVKPGLEDVWEQTIEEPVTSEISVGTLPPKVRLRGRTLQIRSPSSSRAIKVRASGSRRVEVRVLRVKPSQWPAFRKAYQARKRPSESESERPGWPGREQVDRVVKLAEGERMIEEQISYASALDDEGRGHAVVIARIVEKMETAPESSTYRNEMVSATWVQSTRMGLDTFVDRSSMVTWVSSLETGEPMEGVEVAFETNKSEVTTDDQGTAALALPEEREDAEWVTARYEGDSVFIPKSMGAYSSGGWARRDQENKVRWYTADDRELYRPGERVRIKGWFRKVADDGRTMQLPEPGQTLRWVAKGAGGSELASGEAELSQTGGLSVGWRLSEDVQLGETTVTLTATLDGDDFQTRETIEVQEFRTPRFETTVTAGSDAGPAVGQVRAEVRGSYYTGGPMRGADVDWRVAADPADYSPPGHEAFSFGRWYPWWLRSFHRGYRRRSLADGFQDGRTDGQGRHAVTIGVDEVEPVSPVVVKAQATMFGANNQTVTSRSRALVHPSSHYVGLKTNGRLKREGESLRVEALVTTVEGEVVEGRRIDVRAERLAFQSKPGGSSKLVVASKRRCTLTSASEAVTCTVPDLEAGLYRVRARVKDDAGRDNVTEIRRWVVGSQKRETSPRSTSRPSLQTRVEPLELVPGESKYDPGETAEVAVRAPFEEGHGTLVVWRDEMTRRRAFELSDGTATVTFPIEEADVPELRIGAVAAGRRPVRGGAKGNGSEGGTEEYRPAVAAGEMPVKVSTDRRRLSVDVTGRPAEAKPGGAVDVRVSVAGPDGGAVEGAEVAVMAVDEAVLALTGYEVPSPMEVMYREWGPTEYDMKHGRELFVYPEGVWPVSPHLGARMMAAAPPGIDGSATIQLRDDFSPLAHYSSALRTDETGRVETTMNLPDNLTRYRLVAVAAKGASRFGDGRSTVTARKPVVVRPSMPNFMTVGDEAMLSVLVRNRTEKRRRLSVGLRASGLEVDGSGLRVIDLEARGRAEVRFRAEAMKVGRARIQVVGVGAEGESGTEWTDARQTAFPVYAPTTKEAYAAYGRMSAEQDVMRQKVSVPRTAHREYGGLSVSTSSTILQSLADAVTYLFDYRYEGAEQLASRMLATSTLEGDVSRFGTETLPSEEVLDEQVSEDIEALLGRQNRDGGFGQWSPEYDRSKWPFVSLHALHAIGGMLASERGTSHAEALKKAASSGADFLHGLEGEIPGNYSEDVKLVIRAYGAYVSEKVFAGSSVGKSDEPKPRRRLWRNPGAPVSLKKTVDLAESLVSAESPPLEAVGWTLSALAMAKERLTGATDGGGAGASEKGGSVSPESIDVRMKELTRIIDNRAVVDGATAQITTMYEQEEGRWVMASKNRVDAVVLEALLRSGTSPSLVPKLARGLQQNRVEGRWSSTQTTLFVLLALHQYVERRESVKPDFETDIWLGDRFVGEQAFDSYEVQRRSLFIPMAWWADKLASEDQRGEGDDGSTKDGDSSRHTSVTIQKKGPGEMYYRIGLRYAPEGGELEPVSSGFTIQRQYIPVGDDQADGSGSHESRPDESGSNGSGKAGGLERTEDGWRVEAGSRVKVKLTVFAPAGRHHVALGDRLPGGFEPVHPDFEIAAELPDEDRSPYDPWWFGEWYDHYNLRASGAEAFASRMSAGVYTYTYVVRATTPGTYRVAPATIEEMYAPEVSGRTGSWQVEVVPKR